MPSILAIVSKALFEKMVPKDVKLGTVVDTDRYVSKNKTFESLKTGDAIFLVTVRPPDEKLWLVGILESPKKKGDAWVSKANAAILADVTAAIPKLKFESGTGIAAKKGALGMSLQTPRSLTAADEKLLRGFVAGKSAGAKVTASAAYNKAVAEAIGKPKKKKGGGGKLRFEHYRRPFEDAIDDLEPFERKQLDDLASQEGMNVDAIFAAGDDGENEWSMMELVDVVDDKDDVKFQFYLWPYGSGALYANKSTKLVANVCQHGFELVEEKGKAFVRDLAAAYAEGKKRLKIQEMVDFEDDDDEDE